MKDKEEILHRLEYINHQLNRNGFYEHHFSNYDNHFSKVMFTFLQIEKEVLEWVLKGDDE